MPENKDYLTHEETLGTIQISEDVVASIATSTALEVEGVGGLLSTNMSDYLGGKKMTARGVRVEMEGDAIVVSLIDMGGRLRLICQDIHCVKPILPMPNLPVARVMWQAMPDLTTGLECWITAGGAHHTTLTYDVTADQMKDWANMMGIEFVHITKDTTVESLEQQLFLNDLAWKLKG